MKTSRIAVLTGALVTAVALAGCGTASSSSGGSGPSSASASSAAAGTPAATAPDSSTAPASGAGAAPAGGPVPAGFAATSVTFVSAAEAFVLGTAPCAHAPCTSIVRTLDRGADWRGLPAPVVPLGQPENGTSPAVWGIRFADPSHGFVFGNGLWETTDGGEHWAAAAGPGGSIRSLEVIDGQVLALTDACGAQSGCAQTGTLMRRALPGGAWHAVTQVRDPGVIATQARVAALLSGSGVIVTANGGLSYAAHATPCASPGMAWPSSVAVSGQDELALLCAGSAAMGSVAKTVYVSGDLGAHWTKAGTPASGGDPVDFAAATPTRLVIGAASGASWLYYSGDSGTRWGTGYSAGDGGMGWNDLGFTTTSDGVVIHGPARSDGNREGRPGQLLLTSDGGATWQLVRFQAPVAGAAGARQP